VTPHQKNGPKEQLSEKEIALIKAMQKLGKNHGFHNQEILSYFSRPGRSVNPARIREIQDGARGQPIEPASEAALAEFIETFHHTWYNEKADERVSLPDLPVPSRIGIQGGKISFLPPGDASEIDTNSLRSALYEAIHDNCSWFHKNIRNLQIDQSISQGVTSIQDILTADPSELNCVSLLNTLRVLRSKLRENYDGLSTEAAARWSNLEENIVVLLESYPSYATYREAASKLKRQLQIDQSDMNLLVTVLRSDDGNKVVSPEIPLALEQLSECYNETDKEKNERDFAISAISVKVLKNITVLQKLVATLDNTQRSLQNLATVYWPVVRQILEKTGWFN